MVHDEVSTSTQEIDARLHQRMDISIRLLEDELDSKLSGKMESNDAKFTSKLSELDSKFLTQLKSNDTNNHPD